MKKIIFTQSWWSIGECSININVMLNFIFFLKKTYPNLFYCILNLNGKKTILDSCISDLGHFCDEYHKNNFIYSIEHISNNEEKYFKINPYCFMYKDDVDDTIKTIFTYGEYLDQPKVFLEVYDDRFNVLNKIRHFVEVLPKNEIVDLKSESNFKVFYEFTNEQQSFAKDILLEHRIKNFETIHFRWHNYLGVSNEQEIIKYWIDRISPHINLEKTYFLSSSNPMFYKLFEERFSNCFYLDRGLFSDHPDTNKNKPKFVPENISNSDYSSINEYIAHIELNIICKSDKIFHISDGYRNMISLFLWLPLTKYNIPLTWIAFTFDINRSYNLNGCTHQEIIEGNKQFIPIPKSLCEYSNGQLC